ncbi:hypothetical protein AOLI_G00035360 [Acnodon oligacanthus]
MCNSNKRAVDNRLGSCSSAGCAAHTEVSTCTRLTEALTEPSNSQCYSRSKHLIQLTRQVDVLRALLKKRRN